LANRPPREHCLIAGSDPHFCESVLRLLTLEGVEGERAHTPDEAIARIETGRLRMLFVDAAWASGEVGRFVEEVRRRWPRMGIVVTYAAEEQHLVPSCLSEAADDCLSRQRVRTELPIVLARVRARVRQRDEMLDRLPFLERDAAERAERFAVRAAERTRVRGLTLRTLLVALGARESETRRHSLRVAHYGAQLAERLGISPEERARVRQGALLHDLGKIGIPDEILLKPGPLTAAEWAIMHSHPRLGFDILKGLPFLRHAAEVSLCHHERWDGRGYPLRLAAGDIPLSARIIGVADALDAMSVQRPYRDALPFEKIRDELVTNRSTQFDPAVVEQALAIYRSYDDLHPEARRLWHAARPPARRRAGRTRRLSGAA
jgi:putative nucleotidyltransferase with HDIG domain